MQKPVAEAYLYSPVWFDFVALCVRCSFRILTKLHWRADVNPEKRGILSSRATLDELDHI